MKDELQHKILIFYAHLSPQAMCTSCVVSHILNASHIAYGDRCEGQKNTRIKLMTRIGLFTDVFDSVISLRGDADGF